MSEIQPIRITKEYRWEMGHRLSYHTEGCQNLHGHSYRMIIGLTGQTNPEGMIFDFGDISRIAKPIIDQLDHSTMLNQSDQPLVDFLQSQNMKLTLVPFHPTTEELARWILDQLTREIANPGNIHAIDLTIFETATSTVTLNHNFK